METTNNFKPILFSTEMVQAILADRKNQTRRVLGHSGTCVKCGCTDNDCSQCIEKQGKPCYWIDIDHLLCSRCSSEGKTIESKYQIDDILWVRETFIESKTPDIPNNRGWSFSYKADGGYGIIKWKPSLFMPKEAARIFLKVTNVRCERLNDISEEDAILEGIKPAFSDGKKVLFDKRQCFIIKDNKVSDNAKQVFQSLWDSINAKKHPWKSNPWVWVYEFERIEKPENFNNKNL